MILKIVQYLCDFCGAESLRFTEGTPAPKGWVEVVAPVEKTMTDKVCHLCPDCITRVIREAPMGHKHS